MSFFQIEKMSAAEYQAFSEAVTEKFLADTPELDKSAAADMDSMTRKMVREGSFADSFITPKEVGADENVLQIDTDQHVILIPFEPDSPGAVQGYLDAPSDGFYAYGRYYPLVLREFTTNTVQKSLVELETYKYDIRQLLGDNMVKDLIGLKDVMFMGAVGQILGAANSTNNYVGRPLYVQQSSAITFSSFKDSQKPLYDEPFNLEPTRFLTGRLTLPEFEKMAIDEFRGTKIAEDIFNGSLKQGEFNQMPFVSTTKKALVPPGALFFFPDEKFMGQARMHTPPTMHVKREKARISFSYWMIYGMSLGHLGCATRTDFLY
jgi:hypothetical protein